MNSKGEPITFELTDANASKSQADPQIAVARTPIEYTFFCESYTLLVSLKSYSTLSEKYGEKATYADMLNAHGKEG